MAERRMFAKSVILYDRLADMSHASQMLYIHLNMHADDDGFVGNPKPIMAMIRCREKHLQDLIDKGFLLRFDSGLVVITHWRVNNQLRKDRYKATRHLTERSMIKVDLSGLYTVNGEGTPLDVLSPTGCQSENRRDTQMMADEQSPAKQSKAQSRAVEDRPPEPVGEPAQRESSSSSIEFENMVLDLYARYCPSLPDCRFLCDDTRARIWQLEKAGWTQKDLTEAFQLADRSGYLKGDHPDGWKADLHWLCKEDNLCKVLNGRYENWKASRKAINGCTGLGEAELDAIQKLLAEDTAS